MRLLQRCLAGFLLLPLFVVGLLYFTSGDWTQVTAAAFPVGAMVLRQVLSARGRTTTDNDNRDPALPWLVLPAVVLTAGMLPVRWPPGVEIADGVRLSAFLVITLIVPNRCGGWCAPLRWLAAAAVLLLPEGLHTKGVAFDSLFAALRIALLADFIRTGLSGRDVRADQLLAAVGLGVVIALQRSVSWLPIAVLAVATVELAATGALSRPVQAVKPPHDRSRRWLSRGRFVAAIAVAAILWAWTVSQLAPLGHKIDQLGPVVVSAAHRFVQQARATSIPDWTGPLSPLKRSVTSAAKPRDATGRSPRKAGEYPDAGPGGADNVAKHPSVSPEFGDAAAEARAPRERGIAPAPLEMAVSLPLSVPEIERSVTPSTQTAPAPGLGDAALDPPVLLSPDATSGLTAPVSGDDLRLGLPGIGHGRVEASAAAGGSSASPDSRRSSGAPTTAGASRSGANGNGSVESHASSQSQGTPPGSGGTSGQGGQSGNSAESGLGFSPGASNPASASSSGTGKNSPGGSPSGGGETSGGGPDGRGGSSQSQSADGPARTVAQTSGGAAGNASSGEQHSSSTSAPSASSAQPGGSKSAADRGTGADSTGTPGSAASGKNQNSPSSAGGARDTSGARSAQSPAPPQSIASARPDSTAKNGASKSVGAPKANPAGSTPAPMIPNSTATNATSLSSPVAAPTSSDGTPPSTGSTKPGEPAASELGDAQPTPSKTPNRAAPPSPALPSASTQVQSPAKETAATETAAKPPAPSSSPGGLDGASGATQTALDLRRWMLPAALGLALALLIVARLYWRKKPPAPVSSSQLVIEDRREAGRCLYEIEGLLGRNAPPNVAAELTQLHRLGLHLRYGIEFSRDKVTHLESEVRRLRRAIETFGKRLNAGAKRRA